jgi:hypothetical protein
MIDGIVWGDANRNGALDWYERGIGGVTVDLFRDEDYDAVLSAADTYLASTTTTKSNGFYAFTGMPRGAYLVAVSDRDHVLDGCRHTTPPDPLSVHLETDHEAVAVLFGFLQLPAYQIYLPVTIARWSPSAGASGGSLQTHRP